MGKMPAVKTALTTWLLMFGLLLQSVAWALPAQRAMQSDRLAHEVAHAIDHGHHQHSATGHDIDEALVVEIDIALASEELRGGHHGPRHFHAADGAQFQALPVTHSAVDMPLLAFAAPAWAASQPDSADGSGLLRPPKATA